MNIALSSIIIFGYIITMCAALTYALTSLIWAIITRIEKRKKDRQAKWRH